SETQFLGCPCLINCSQLQVSMPRTSVILTSLRQEVFKNPKPKEPEEGSFCLTQSHSSLVPNKHTEAYINYKPIAQAYYYLAPPILLINP
ncbi:hypothetical protein ACQP3C_26065, partial [Escherichia coli]